MPSPIVHAVAGLVLAKVLPLEEPKSHQLRQWKLPLFYGVFVATAADLDFVPQILLGGNFHRGLSHSLLFAIVFGAISAGIASGWWKTSYRKLMIWSWVLYGSHLILDYFSAGRGIKFWLPFVDRFYKAPTTLFPGLHYSEGLWHSSHLPTLIFEFVLCAIVLGVVWGWQRGQSLSNK